MRGNVETFPGCWSGENIRTGTFPFQAGAGLAPSRTEESAAAGHAVRDPGVKAFVVLSLRSPASSLGVTSVLVYFPSPSGHSVQPFDLNHVLQSQKNTLSLIFPLCFLFTLRVKLLALLVSSSIFLIFSTFYSLFSFILLLGEFLRFSIPTHTISAIMFFIPKSPLLILIIIPAL